MTRRNLLFVTLGMCTMTAAASAHEFWLEPDSYIRNDLSPIRVGARVGEHFQGKPVTRDAKRIVKFIGRVGDHTSEVVGHDGGDVSIVRFDQPGLGIIAFQSNHKYIELPADRFESYLKEEGLNHMIELRKQRGESTKPGREIYSRSAKSLIKLVADTEEPDAPIGLRLELVALKNPYTLSPGNELPVQLLIEGDPLPNAAIKAVNKKAPCDAVEAKTNELGIAELRLPSAGEWLITSIHMQEAPADSGADWESLWASMTLELPAPRETAR